MIGRFEGKMPGECQFGGELYFCFSKKDGPSFRKGGHPFGEEPANNLQTSVNLP